MNKFKVGERVKIIKPDDNAYNGLEFYPIPDHYVNQIVTITEIRYSAFHDFFYYKVSGDFLELNHDEFFQIELQKYSSWVVRKKGRDEKI